MPDLLQIGATIDLSQVLPGLNTLQGETATTTSAMNTSFAEAQSGMLRLPPTVLHVEGSTRGAREAMRGLGEEMGLHLPRFVSSFLASVGPIGGIMAAAFAPIAIIGLLEFLGKIPEAIKNASDSIMGYGEAQKKAFAETVKASDEALVHFKSLELGIKLISDSARAISEIPDSFVGRYKWSMEEASKATMDWGSELKTGAFEAVVPFGALIDNVHSFTRAEQEASDVVTKLTDRQIAQLEQMSRLADEQNKATLKVQVEHLKAGEIGATAYAKIADQLRALKVEEDAEAYRMQFADRAGQKAIDTMHALYAARADAIKRTGAVETGEQSVAADRARIESEHEIADTEFSIRKAELEREASERRIGSGVELAALKALSAQKMEVDAQYYADRRALELRESAITGKPAAAAISGLNAKQTAEALNQTAALNKAADNQIISGAERVEAAIRANFSQQMKDSAEAVAEQIRGQRAVISMDQQQFEIAEMTSSRTLRLAQMTDTDRLRSHQISTRQWQKDEQAAVEEWYRTQRTVMAEELADAKRFYGEQSIEYQRIIAKMDALDTERRTKLEAINQKEEMDITRIYERMSNVIGQNLTQVLAKHQSLASAILKIENQMAEGIISNLIKVTAQRLIGMAEKKTMDKTDIMGSARSAAAGAYSALSDIPLIGPALGAAAAAATFAAVMAFGSFDEGGVAKKTGLAMIHQSEIVMPPSVSHAFTAMSGGGAMSRQVNQRNEIHLHHNGPDAREVLDRELAPRIQRLMRRGEIPTP